MSDTAIVFVTRDGHSRAIAHELGAALGAPVHEIVDLVSRKGFIGYMRSGFQASTGRASPIKDPGVDLAGARKIVLVQPVWASGVCPPLRTWLRSHKDELAGKRLFLIASDKVSPPEPLRAKFEAEFGKLVHIAALRESASPEERQAVLAGVKKALG